jgi:regulator of sirC expression with transglutaminase-like and TPR domain
MNLDLALATLAADPAAPLDVAEVALMLARDEYPALDVESELADLSAMARELKPRLRGGLSAQVEALCRYLFHEQGFAGNSRDYHDPRNSYLNEVLARRTGLPITLSVVTAAVAARAGLHVEGVGLPGHFIVKAVHRNEEIFLDPFHGGRRLSLADCASLVATVSSTFEVTPDMLAAVPAGAVVERMLRNLEGVYLRRRDYPRAARVIGRLCQLAPGDVCRRRDLGTALLQSGKPGQAIDHLATYLAGDPPPVDSASIRDLLDQASGEVARWN